MLMLKMLCIYVLYGLKRKKINVTCCLIALPVRLLNSNPQIYRFTALRTLNCHILLYFPNSREFF